jgi:DNA-binding PadR family transcriptional regulator
MDISTHLPLTEATYYILLSLAPNARHGYAIMKDVRALSHERVVLSTGTLYGALKRLLEMEWILRVDDPEADGDGRERKLYSLTGLGRRVLEAEVARLDTLIESARRQSVEPLTPQGAASSLNTNPSRQATGGDLAQ